MLHIGGTRVFGLCRGDCRELIFGVIDARVYDMAFGIAALANDSGRFELAEIHAAEKVIVLFDAFCVRRVLAILVDREIGSGFADGEEAAEVLADGTPVDLVEVAADDDVIYPIFL